jgi:N-hydroxyarylamine O-acetyltransferase
MDIQAYLDRVGLPGEPPEPTLDALRRLHRAHVDAIAFANVEPALGRVPSLDLPTLERRLVDERRGGYCMEHATLFAAVLREVGFPVELRLQLVGDPVPPRPPTHLAVLARPADDPRRWMADVGFGVGVIGPVPLPDGGAGEGEPVRHGSWEHRADVEDGRVVLLERDDAGWRPLHAGVDADPAEAAIAASNTWVALQEGSPFAGRLVAMRTTEHRRERLRGTRLEVAEAGGGTDERMLSPEEALDELGRRFGVAVDEEDRAELRRLLTASSQAAAPR